MGCSISRECRLAHALRGSSQVAEVLLAIRFLAEAPVFFHFSWQAASVQPRSFESMSWLHATAP